MHNMYTHVHVCISQRYMCMYSEVSSFLYSTLSSHICVLHVLLTIITYSTNQQFNMMIMSFGSMTGFCRMVVFLSKVISLSNVFSSSFTSKVVTQCLFSVFPQGSVLLIFQCIKDVWPHFFRIFKFLTVNVYDVFTSIASILYIIDSVYKVPFTI